MKKIFLLFLLAPALSGAAPAPLPPVPASRLEEALAVTRAVDAWQIKKPSAAPVLRVVYFTPKDVEPQTGYRERLTRIMNDVSDFYRVEMKRNGFGEKGLPLEMENGKLKLHEVKGALPEASYQHESGDQTEREMRKALQGTVDFDREFVLALYGMCRKNKDGSYFFYAPYYGKGGSNQMWGLCHAADCELLDPALLPETGKGIVYDEHYGHFEKTLADFNTAYLGGIAHELGHGLSLPHDRETPQERRAYGASLMGNGNLTYRRELWRPDRNSGSFLTFATCLRLAAHPLFSGGERERFTKPAAAFKDLKFSGKPRVMHISGQIETNVPCHSVIAYCDPDEPRGDYDAVPFSVPVKDGKFDLEMDGHRPGGYALRLAALHLNGATTTRRFQYRCDEQGVPNAEEMDDPSTVREIEFLAVSDPASARRRLTDEFIAAAGREENKRRLTHLRTLLMDPKPLVEPSAATGDTLFLSDAISKEATVGWGEPVRNRMGGAPQVTGHLLLFAAGRFYDKGLYAHSPSRYSFQLDGKWKTFEAGAAIQDGDSRKAAFIVVGDGKELGRVPVVKPGKVEKLNADVTGVKLLELVVEGPVEKDSHAWSIWLEPKITKQVPK